MDNTLDWREWLTRYFPNAVRGGFSSRHDEFWDWVWSIESGVRPRPFVALWPRGGGKSTSAELAVVAIGLRERRRYCIYVCETQEQADDHLNSIATKLEEADVERKLNKYGSSMGWRRNRLRAANFTVDALGLDVASRGKKIDDDRPDLVVFDDIDNEKDTVATVDKKRKTITKGILPAMAKGGAVLFAQNLIHRGSIATELSNLVSGTRADYLSDRIVSGPYKAIEGFKAEPQYDAEEGANRWAIVEGSPTWQGQDIADCEAAIKDYGLDSFVTESQQDVLGDEGKVFRRHWFDDGNADPLQNTRWVLPFQVPSDALRVRGYDLAATENGGDWTAAPRIAKAGNSYFVEDMVRVQQAPTERNETIRNVAKSDGDKYGSDKVLHIGPEDPAAAGKSDAITFKQLFVGYRVMVERVTGSKIQRGSGFRDEAGKLNVFLVLNEDGSVPAWFKIFIDELVLIDETKIDAQTCDQMDAVVTAFNQAKKMSGYF